MSGIYLDEYMHGAPAGGISRSRQVKQAQNTHKHSWCESTEHEHFLTNQSNVPALLYQEDSPIVEDGTVPSLATTYHSLAINCEYSMHPSDPLLQKPGPQGPRRTHHNSGGTGFTPSHS